MSDTGAALGGFGDILRRAQAESDHAIERIREDTAQRQAAALAAQRARQSTWPERNRTPVPPPDVTALRERLRQAQAASQLAMARLREALEAGRRGEDHCAAMRKRLGTLDEVERRHAGRLASVLRAGGPGDQLTPEVASARAARPGLERDCAAADEACGVLAEDIGRAQREMDAAKSQVNESVKMIMSAEARRIADEIDRHERVAGELYRSISPLAQAWFGSHQGEPGGPVPIDTATRAVFAKPPRLSGTDNVPPGQAARNAADAAARWKTFFDELCADADAELGTEAA